MGLSDDDPDLLLAIALSKSLMVRSVPDATGYAGRCPSGLRCSPPCAPLARRWQCDRRSARYAPLCSLYRAPLALRGHAHPPRVPRPMVRSLFVCLGAPSAGQQQRRGLWRRRPDGAVGAGQSERRVVRRR
eukprot:2633804-Prymnesium_polylepis.1